MPPGPQPSEVRSGVKSVCLDMWLPKGRREPGRDGLGVWGQQTTTITHRTDGRQGPAEGIAQGATVNVLG